MDLKQQKLTKSEWEYLEIPVDRNEQTILNLIFDGYQDVNTSKNDALTLLLHMKIGTDDVSFHSYLYEQYFKNTIDKLIKKYNLKYVDTEFKNLSKKKTKIKTADLIRIKNSSKKVEALKEYIYEFIILNHISKFLKKKLCPKTYFTICQLLNNSIRYINKFVSNFITFVLNEYESKIDKYKLIKKAYSYIEKNKEIFRFNDLKLYEHQQKLFTAIKRTTNKLILYQAPTGTGKTMSPVGLANGKSNIYLCSETYWFTVGESVYFKRDSNCNSIWM